MNEPESPKINYSVMTERTRLISYFLYGLFSAVLKKNTIKPPEVIFHIRLRAQEVIRGRVHRTEMKLAMRSIPQDTVPLIMRQFLSHFNFKKTY